ncbi:MAG: hypothetical protein ACOCYT_05480 [Chloroflexota bacterium]
MRNDIARAFTTFFMWLFLVSVSIIAVSNNAVFGSGGIEEMITVIMPLLVGMIGTMAIWRDSGQGTRSWDKREMARSQSDNMVDRARKAKHGEGDRHALLMALMTEEEREALKDGLRRQMFDSYDDGELPGNAESLGRLLDEDARQARH